MKVGYALITQCDSLWITLLWEKYKVSELCPLSIYRPKCSPLWRGLSLIWDDLRRNIAWTVGNGHTLNFWNDNWVPNLGPLRHHALRPDLVDEDTSIVDFATIDGHWNIEPLSSLLPTTAINHIASIKPPDICDADDLCLWKWGALCRFTTASAYNALAASLWKPKCSLWPAVSKLKFLKEFVQLDTSTAIKLITAASTHQSPFSIIRAIHRIRQRCWVTDMEWIPRVCNKIADAFAKMTPPDSFQL
ncbi:hypothetical protein F3Y22_tig00111721pilonHSYRG00154 [Hibiscus syriacus]|uniref:RNase H type-1 domain-containing protein n=1 Tax=Hibiscus syriacus TaxID=106335 RepID=A0A6A2YI21_HIBSY|nr:hypothetical protein F3Y22_tig00111721pilonHSYRG00154 [Hibiscus syriacus]